MSGYPSGIDHSYFEFQGRSEAHVTLCAAPECFNLPASGCEHCPDHELQAAIEAEDIDLIAYWIQKAGAQ